MADPHKRPINIAEESIIAAMKNDGWDTASLEVVRLWWEYEALDQECRKAMRREFGMKMLMANGWRFDFPNGCPVPEPLEQLRVAIAEVAGSEKPHLFFPRDNSGRPTSEARAYSHDVRERILALAASAVVRLNENHGVEKNQAIEHVAKLLAANRFTSSRGKISADGVAGLTKHVATAEQGTASFQEYYDFAVQFEPMRDTDVFDSGVYRLLEVLVSLCKNSRLL
jgi:hypothetical protein